MCLGFNLICQGWAPAMFGTLGYPQVCHTVYNMLQTPMVRQRMFITWCLYIVDSLILGSYEIIQEVEI